MSNFHFFFEQTFSYILNKSAQNKEASNPPVPALISTIAFLSSSSSLGKRKIFSLFSCFLFLLSISCRSFFAISNISLSFFLSCMICSKSFFSLSKFTNSLASKIIPSKFEYSFDFLAKIFGSIFPDASSFSNASCLIIISFTFCIGIIN